MHRHADTPYFAGPGGITSESGIGPAENNFVPDLVEKEDRINLALMIRL